MLQAMHSLDSNDSRIRQLLDERSAHTDALRYSEGDTPSVYSPACFSPQQTDKPSSSCLLDDPSSSVLDFDEDVRSSVVPTEAYQDDGSDQDPLTRMSYLGPKMRFHSRAPWELEEDTLEDVDETASTAHSGHSGFMGMLTGSRGKPHKADSPSSPRPSTATGRPSAESNRSFLNSKHSFDTSMPSTTHPRGALYALAQESLSTSSLGRPHYSGRQEGLRGKFSLGRLRSHSSTLDIPSSPNDSAARLPLPTIASPSPRASCDTTNSSTLDVQTGLNALFVDRRIDKGFHPYASPELTSYSLEPLPPKSPVRSNSQYPEVPRKDSNSTVVEVPSFSGPAKVLTTSTPTPETSKRRVSHIQGKGISGPVNVLIPDSPIHLQPDEPVPLPRAIPGWTERNINPGFSLISLEEARAQRRGTALPSPETKTHEASSSGDSSTMTAVETSTLLASDANHSEFAAARARGRSISAGAKAKNVLSSLVRQPERRGSENGFVTGFESSNAKDNAAAIASKNLKHKKSGFMRLFGNGKVNEKEPPLPPPPSAHSLPQFEVPAFTPRHNPKPSSHRIPVPSLSPSLLEAATRLEGTYQSGDSDVIDISRASASSKRSLPYILSISTGSSSRQISPQGHFTGFEKDESLPQSAPPDVGDFPTLKLRPISTLFSTHFGDHIDVTKLNFDEEESIGPKETKEDVMARRRETERPRLDSLTSTSVSSGPSSASATSSQYNLSPIAPSFTGTTLTTPTTGGIVSPTSNSTAGPPWIREHDHVLGGGRFSIDQQSTPPSLSPNASSSSHVLRERDVEATTTIRVLQEHLDSTNKMWQKRVWDLENEVRTLKNELAGLKLQKHNEGCEKCGRGGNGIPLVPALSKSKQQQMLKGEGGIGGVMNRPRAKTGSSARFVNGQI